MKRIMRSLSVLLLSAILSTTSLVSTVFADSNGNGAKIVLDKKNLEIDVDCPYAEDHVNVITKSCLDGVKLSHNKVTKNLAQIFTGKDYTAYKVYFTEGYDVISAINELNKEDYVLYSEPDYCNVIENGSVDPKTNNADQWHHEAIHTFEAWEQLDKLPKTNKVRVAVFDSLFNLQDPDLFCNVNMIYSCDYSTGDKKGVDWYSEKSDHANHCAGLIAANPNNDNGIAGVATGSNNDLVELVCISLSKRSDRDTNLIATDTDISAMAGAIVYASECKCKIGSISVELTKHARTKIIELAVETAYINGMLLVAAVGNTGTATVNYPACCDKCVSVSELYVDSTGTLRYSPHSSYSKVDISAPGARILSLDSHNGTVMMSGTSMSAPIVAGVISLVMAVDSKITPFEAYEIVKATSIDVESTGFDQYTGYGCVNAYEAVREAVRRYAPSYLMTQEISNNGLNEVPYSSPVNINEVITLLTNTLINVKGITSKDFSTSYLKNLTEGNLTLAQYFSDIFGSQQFWKQSCKLSDTEFIKLVFRITIGIEPNSATIQGLLPVFKYTTRVGFIRGIVQSDTLINKYKSIYSTIPLGDFTNTNLFWNKYR